MIIRCEVFLSKTAQANIALSLAAFFWGTTFIIQRQAMEYLSPLAFSGLRFTLGGLCLLPLAWIRASSIISKTEDRRLLFKTWAMGGLISGGFIFVGVALQQYGLLWTTAGKAGFITSLYVVLVPIVMLVLFRRKINLGEGIGVVLATIGLFLLRITESRSLLPGDSPVLIVAFVWTFHVIYPGPSSPRVDSLVLGAGQALLARHNGRMLLIDCGEARRSPCASWAGAL